MRKENGILYFKENWFLKYFWGINFWRALPTKEKPIYPRNLCSLFWGSLLGISVAMPISCILFALAFCTLIISEIVAGFFGFYPPGKGDARFFGDYKYWGDRKISVAAWEVCAFLLGLYLAIKYGPIAVSLMINSTVAAVLVGILFVIGFLLFLFKTTPGKVMREYIKAAKRKVCPPVVIEPSEK